MHYRAAVAAAGIRERWAALSGEYNERTRRLAADLDLTLQDIAAAPWADLVRAMSPTPTGTWPTPT